MKSNARDLSGEHLDRYTLEQRLTRSTMSAVYWARHLQLARPIAVKVMNGGLDNEFLLRFRHEARLMAQLDHANIIPIYDYGEQDGLVYLVMPYFPGGSLLDLLSSQGRRSRQEILAYLQQAASALDSIHSCGIVNLDLKPSIFLLHRDGQLVLTDFGIARVMRYTNLAQGSSPTSTESLLGTPSYMPPELIRGEQIDSRADIYQLGIVLYQLLCGDLPFRGDSVPLVLRKHLYESPPPLHERDATISPKVDAVVRRAIAKRRDERFPSAMALALALEAVSTPYSCSAVTGRALSRAAPVRTPSTRMQTAPARSDGPFACARRKAVISVSNTAHPARPQPRVNASRISVVVLLSIVLVILALLAYLLAPPMPRTLLPGVTAPLWYQLHHQPRRFIQSDTTMGGGTTGWSILIPYPTTSTL